MRVLFVSNFYPPYSVGGWEQLVQEINAGLSARGHVTHVLTSRHGVDHQPPLLSEDGVERILDLEADLLHYDIPRSFLLRKPRLRRNMTRTRRVVSRFQPDVAFVHGMWNLSRAVPWTVEQMLPDRVAYYVADDSPYAADVHAGYWRGQGQSWPRKYLKSLLAPLAGPIVPRQEDAFRLQYRRVLCVSKAVRSNLARHAGIPIERMQVVYNGIDLDRFTPGDTPTGRAGDGSLSLLYSGSVAPHKGVRTAIEAMGILRREGNHSGFHLTIAGSGHPDYEAGLKQLVEVERLQDRVRFRPRVPRDEMPDLLRQFDVLVFPSVWEEPLARAVQEAMATGLVVVGTTTGGTKEILVEGETGLTFEPGDAAGLARQVERLAKDPKLRSRLRGGAREMVHRNFDIQRMIDELEVYLAEVVRTGSCH